MFIRPGRDATRQMGSGRSCFRCGPAERRRALHPSLKSNEEQGGASSEGERVQTSSHREKLCDPTVDYKSDPPSIPQRYEMRLVVRVFVAACRDGGLELQLGHAQGDHVSVAQEAARSALPIDSHAVL